MIIYETIQLVPIRLVASNQDQQLRHSTSIVEENEDTFVEDQEGLKNFRFLGVPLDYNLTSDEEDILLQETKRYGGTAVL